MNNLAEKLELDNSLHVYGGMIIEERGKSGLPIEDYGSIEKIVGDLNEL